MNDEPSPGSIRNQVLGLVAEGGRDAADRLFGLGARMHQAGDLAAALSAFEGTVKLDPTRVAGWQAVATLRFQLGRPKAALEACNQALRLAPDNADSLFNTAVVLESLADIPAALHCYERVLTLDSRHFGALLNRVPLLVAQQRLDEALSAARLAIEAYPDSPDCWFNLGEVHTTAGRHDEALTAYERVLVLQPGSGKALVAVAVSEAALGRLERAGERLEAVRVTQPEALVHFRSPLLTDRSASGHELNPGRIALIAAYQRYRVCDWASRDAFIDLYRRVVEGQGCKPLDSPDLLFPGLALPLSRQTRLRAAGQVAARIVAGVHGCHLVQRRRTSGGRLRIGYISGDFRRHPMPYLISPLLERRNAARFEIFAYSTGPDDDSELRRRIRDAADTFCDVAKFDAHGIAQRIAFDGIDILVDLSAHMLYSRSAALALRPAKVQVSYFAYLSTLNAPWIDYAILDRMVLPDEERPGWGEKICYLPQTLLICNDHLPPPQPRLSRSDVGLPDDCFVFCSLNAPWKIDPETFDVWIRILGSVPESVLWIYADTAACADNLREAAHARGFDAGRLIFTGAMPHEDHLARFRLADVFLDTFSCNGHTTTIEALQAGLPVLTLAGRGVVARVAASALKAHGVPELIAGNPEEYLAIACRLAKDARWLQQIRERVARREGSALFSSERRVREFEHAYEMMWERHQAGLPPADFDVPPLG